MPLDLNAVNTPPPARRAALGFIFVSIVLDVLTFGIIIQVLRRLIEEFVAFDTVMAATMYGVFGTV